MDDETHHMLFDLVEEVPNVELTIDLASQRLSFPGMTVEFPVDAFAKTCLLNGVDELGYILESGDRIAAYEQQNGIAIIS